MEGVNKTSERVLEEEIAKYRARTERILKYPRRSYESSNQFLSYSDVSFLAQYSFLCTQIDVENRNHKCYYNDVCTQIC